MVGSIIAHRNSEPVLRPHCCKAPIKVGSPERALTRCEASRTNGRNASKDAIFCMMMTRFDNGSSGGGEGGGGGGGGEKETCG